MNFERIDILSIEELEQEYNDLIETGNDTMLVQYYWVYIACRNGIRNQFRTTCTPWYSCGMDCAYTVGQECLKFGYGDFYCDAAAVTTVCGSKEFGTLHVNGCS